MGIIKARRYCPEDDRMVMAEKQTPNHILHLLLTLLTAGIWLIIWIALSVFNSNPYRCTSCGAATKRSAPWGWKPSRNARREAQEDY